MYLRIKMAIEFLKFRHKVRKDNHGLSHLNADFGRPAASSSTVHTRWRKGNDQGGGVEQERSASRNAYSLKKYKNSY
jgi:hypothetical protein